MSCIFSSLTSYQTIFFAKFQVTNIQILIYCKYSNLKVNGLLANQDKSMVDINIEKSNNSDMEDKAKINLFMEYTLVVVTQENYFAKGVSCYNQSLEKYVDYVVALTDFTILFTSTLITINVIAIFAYFNFVFILLRFYQHHLLHQTSISFHFHCQESLHYLSLILLAFYLITYSHSIGFSRFLIYHFLSLSIDQLIINLIPSSILKFHPCYQFLSYLFLVSC